MTGFVMNTRRASFDDWRVREAMIQAFNFEFINETHDRRRRSRASPPISRTPSWRWSPGRPTGRVRELLEPFADELLPGALDGYALPVSRRHRAQPRQHPRARSICWSRRAGRCRTA